MVSSPENGSAYKLSLEQLKELQRLAEEYHATVEEIGLYLIKEALEARKREKEKDEQQE